MSKIDSSKLQDRSAAAAEANRERAAARERGTMKLTSRYTLEPIDDRNWAMCDEGTPIAYWSSYEDALRGCARRLLDRSIRATLSATSLQELASVVERAKQAVIEELRLWGR